MKRLLVITALTLFVDIASGQQREDTIGPCIRDSECMRGQFCNVPTGTCDTCGVWKGLPEEPMKCKEDAMTTTTPISYGGCTDDTQCQIQEWCFERKCHDCSILKDSPVIYQQRCQDNETETTTRMDSSDASQTMGTVVTAMDTVATTMKTNIGTAAMMENISTVTTDPPNKEQKTFVIKTEYIIFGTVGLTSILAVVGISLFCIKWKPWQRKPVPVSVLQQRPPGPNTIIITIQDEAARKNDENWPPKEGYNNGYIESIEKGIEESDKKAGMSKDEAIIAQEEGEIPSSEMSEEAQPRS